jgi:hypothetical protein
MSKLPLAALLAAAAVCAGADAASAQAALSGVEGPASEATVSRDGNGGATVRAIHVPGGLRVDGRLDDEIYLTSPPITDFLQQEPDEGRLATERTEAWVFFDDNHIYVAARCWESRPDRRVANEMRRDTSQLRQNDSFGVLFDTFHDRRNGYFFYANPIGGLADSQITDEGPPNTDWNTVWDVKTGVFDEGWTIEIAIPFKSLRYQPAPEQTWGINLRRVVRWKNEWSYLTQVPRALTTFRGILKISSAGTLVGLRVPTSTRNMELKPYVLGGATTDRTLPQPLDNDVTRRVGGDFRYAVTENLTTDVTLNTDFAQVEVDEQQVNLTRFNLFFPEKRDFFLENLGVFAFAGRASAGLAAGTGDTPYLFFSRRIGLDDVRTVPLRVGGRVTGKSGRFTYGFLDVHTGEDSTRTVDPANFAVVRVKRDILRRSSIGGMITHRTETPGVLGTNEGYGVDTALGFYQNVRIDAYLAKTRSEGRTGNDLSYRGAFDYNADRYGLQVEQLVVEPNFRPEIGFVRRTDMRRSAGLARFSPRPASLDPIRKLTFQGNINYITNLAHRLDSREQTGSFQTEFTNSDVAGVSYIDTFERLVRPFPIVPGVVIPIGAYNFETVQLSYTAGQQRPISGAIVYEQGTFYDGHRRSLSVNSGRVQVTPRVSIEPSLTLNRIELPQSAFTTSVVRGRATFTVTPRMFFSGITQYNSTARSVSSNLRLRWEYLPGSELFVVYTDDYDSEPPPGIPSLRNRALVIKFNRLFRP